MNVSFGRLSVALLFVLLTVVGCESHTAENNSAKSSQGFHQMVSEMDILYSPTKYSSKRDILFIIDSLYKELPHPTTEDLCNKYLLASQYSNDDPPRKMRYADSVIFLVRSKSLEKNLPHIYGKAYLFKGEALMRENKFNDAYRCYYEGIRIIQTTSDTFAFDHIYGDLGKVCYLQGDYLHASNYFKKSLDEETSYPKRRSRFINFQYRQRNMDNIGLCYDKLGMTDSAIYYYNMALNYINDHDIEFEDQNGARDFVEIARGVVYGNMGTTYYNKGDYKDAETLYSKSIGINTKKGYEIVDARLTQLKLADLYIKSARLKEANALLDTLRASFDTDALVVKEVKLQWYKLKSNYYDSVKSPEQAFTYLSTYLVQKDSEDAANKKLAGIDFSNVFEDINQENLLVALKREDDIRNLNNVIAIIFLTMIIGIAIFISRNNRQLKKLNAKVILQNKEMQQALHALEQSQRENTRMMEIVAHDLRDPLGAIKSMAGILLEDQENEQTQKEFLSLIETSSTSLLGMITDMLSANITEESMKKEAVDMKVLLQYCVDLLKFKATNKNQNIKLHAEEITLDTDREKIWRVVSNLVTNALKFSPDSSSIKVEMHNKQGVVQISVKDDGIGIPNELKGKIFDVLANTKKRTGTQGERSFGLGLSISKQIVEALGGKIWFESTEGEGTVFYVEFSDSMIVN